MARGEPSRGRCDDGAMSDERDAFGHQRGEPDDPIRTKGAEAPAPLWRRAPSWVMWMVAADAILVVVVVAVVLLA
jgi:hypothetical protein